ncbi:PSP1 domain-containing protein [Anaerotardibacter muris]|uniref:PSP1 domain-containing protein n=1 Tax=Anaerotardibacter muris TaxID=2941505 RepID=UPI0023B99D6E|nr:regulatory iron-sulfur-containing complex subunit RicT [Anaerotardibacter muris]
MGDDVIVNTSRGLEFGIATSDVLEVSDELIANLKSPLKPVERLATPEDVEQARKMEKKSDEALRYFKEIALETNKEMHPVMVEYLFEGDKAVFYFEAEERIDFRELVRKLASYFHVRVDMRQIGVRDGARIIGGMGHCGQVLCCTRFGGEFSPVSIRMAKEQNLSLNPQKISGVCGRLMCCLRYEFDTYKEFNSRAPKMGAKIETPEGIAKVTDINVPSETISIKLEDDTVLKIPLDDFEKPEEGRRPHAISEEVFEEYMEKSQLEGMGGAGLIDVVNFSGEDILAQPRPDRSEDQSSGKDGNKRRRRRRGRSGSGGEGSEGQNNNGGNQSKDGSKSGKNSNSRRRNRRGSGNGSGGSNGSGANNSNKNNDRSKNSGKDNNRSNGSKQNRPGQKSSGLSGLRNEGAKKPSQGSSSQGGSGATSHRKARRRRHTTGGDAHDGGES